MADLFINCIKAYLLVSLVLWVCAGYVYRVNSKRTADDPSKKDFHPAAIYLTPIWPIFAAAWILLFVLRAMLYGIFLLLFTIGLIVIRKPFIVVWLSKAAAKIGNKLLQANMLLIRLFFPRANPQTAK